MANPASLRKPGLVTAAIFPTLSYMSALNEEQTWAAMMWLAHTHARTGDFSKANALLDLVQVESKARRESTDGDTEIRAAATFHAVIELRRSLQRLARS